MAISMNDIQTGVIRTINTLVGKDSCPNRQLFTNPVIKARQGGSKLTYPFLVVDKLPLRSYGIDSQYDSNNEGFNNTLVTLKSYVASIIIDCHGSKDDDVLLIMQQVRDILYTQFGQELVSENTGGSILSISDPTYTFNYLQTEYEEVSRITLELSVTSVFEDSDPNCPSTGEITSISGGGNINNKSITYDAP